MLDGAATLVTGGTVVDAKHIEPEEIRGANVTGGETRRIVKGDVIVIFARPTEVPMSNRECAAAQLYRLHQITFRYPLPLWERYHGFEK
jgi:hypothetical protein